MATLVLTTVGTLVGGPIGGAIGSVLGASLDQRLLGGARAVRGPRLGELSVQTSAYGTAIPRLFGTLRVAGTVIWATDLQERSSTSRTGKGQPKVTSYSYSASFAVALSGRAIRGVQRIWADGNLLRGAGGDWKYPVAAFRLHSGDEDQAVDPLIASAEGLDATPAYRGTAYAVFEGLELADFGNRIPSLSFEIEADAGAVPLGTIARVLSDGAVAGGTAAAFAGFAASGSSVRGAIEALAAAVPLSISDDGAVLRLSDSAPLPAPVPADDLAASRSEARAPARIERRAAGTLPDAVAITYYDPARDYQTGSQRARRGGAARRETGVELAAAIPAPHAKAMAEARLAQDWAARATAQVQLPWRWLALRPGGGVLLPGSSERWRIAEWAFEGMALKLGLVALPGGAPSPAAAADAGRATAQTDAAHGPTALALLDLPAVGEAVPDAPRLWIAADGPEAGWRRAALIASTDDGGRWEELGGTAARAVLGTAQTALPEGETRLRDAVNSVEVVLLNPGSALLSRTDTVENAAANLALIGDELVQFADAEWLGSGRWRLRGLLRGRRGTEWAAGLHQPGERFVLIEAGTLVAFDPPLSAIGGRVRVAAQGIGDGASPAEAAAVLAGCALQPPSPVHLRMAREGDDDIFTWTRRSRAGWAWLDGVDAPLAEAGEAYRVVLTTLPGGTVRTLTVTAPRVAYPAAARGADRAGGATTIEIRVAQLGLAASQPAVATFALEE